MTVQENLHLALARLAEAVREQLHSVCSKPAAEEMLRGPRGGEPPERYYGASTRKARCDSGRENEVDKERCSKHDMVTAIVVLRIRATISRVPSPYSATAATQTMKERERGSLKKWLTLR